MKPPEILLIFFSIISVTKGVGVNLLKIGSKRRRTQAEIKQEKEEVALREQDLQEKLALAEKMAAEFQEVKRKSE